jgi:hypothetical protein
VLAEDHCVLDRDDRSSVRVGICDQQNAKAEATLLSSRRLRGESGVVAVLQRPQSDLRLHAHVHAVFVDGGFAETRNGEGSAERAVRFASLGHVRTREVGAVLERASARMRNAGVIGSASRLRSRVVPTPPVTSVKPAEQADDACKRKGRYRPWAELMMRALQIDVLECPRCKGRVKLRALVTDLDEARRFARDLGDPTELPPRAPARGPPFWQSRALRRLAGEAA